jgi:hypothetical protein
VATLRRFADSIDVIGIPRIGADSSITRRLLALLR